MKHMTFQVQYDMPYPTWLPAMWHGIKQLCLTHGTIGHVLEHGEVKGSHMTLNVQYKNTLKLI